MPLTDEERQEILARRQAQPTPSLPGTIPQEILGMAFPSSMSVGTGRSRVNLTVPPPASEVQRQQAIAQSKATLAEDSATRRQLLKKAADQKLQLEQSIALFTKIYDESESAVPVIEHPEGTLPLQQASRFAGRKLGLREKQRGTIESLQARATPALKSLGEVGVLTNQDIQRMLQGGFPSDYDTAVSRQAKREGIISDLQQKLDQVNATLGGSGTRQTDLQQVDPNLQALQQQFPGATIRRKQ